MLLQFFLQTQSALSNIDLVKEAYNSLTGELIKWFNLTVKTLPKLVLAIVVLVLFYFIAKTVKSLINKTLSKWVDHKNLLELASQIVFTAILLLGTFFALGVLELDKTVTSLLAGAGVIGLALSFAFQDLATNFVSGVFITVQKPLRVGDLVETNNYTGIVKKIGLRAIDIEDFDGRYIIIPSKEVFQNPLINYSEIKYRRINLSIGISYGDNMKEARKLLYNTVKGVKEVSTNNGDVRVDFDGFGDSSVNFIVRCFIDKTDQNSYQKAEIEVATAVKEAFDQNDIMIPFPIRTLDFGIRGGEKLDEVVSFDGKKNTDKANNN